MTVAFVCFKKDGLSLPVDFGTCAYLIPHGCFNICLHLKPQPASMRAARREQAPMARTQRLLIEPSSFTVKLFKNLSLCGVCVCARTRACVGALGGQKALDSPELEFQADGSLLVWVLGTELGSSARTAHVLNC